MRDPMASVVYVRFQQAALLFLLFFCHFFFTAAIGHPSAVIGIDRYTPCGKPVEVRIWCSFHSWPIDGAVVLGSLFFSAAENEFFPSANGRSSTFVANFDKHRTKFIAAKMCVEFLVSSCTSFDGLKHAAVHWRIKNVVETRDLT